MSESALEAPRVRTAPAKDRMPLTRAIDRVRRNPTWWLATVALLLVSVLLVAWAKTRPSYDAFGWLVWGYQTLHGTLDLGGSPSWKPLPFVFTVPFALFGHAQLWLWMYTAVTLSLAGCLFAGRIAYRLTVAGTSGEDASAARETDPPRRVHFSGLAAGVFAGVALLGIEDYLHYILSVQSDPVIVTCVLGAIDQHLCGRRRTAFVLLLLAGLGRPEAWPWLGLYALWLWLRVPGTRALVLAGAAVLLFLWFGVPTITNGRPFVSAQLAFNSPRELRHNQVFGTIGRYHELLYWPTWIAALLSVVVAALRRNRLVLALAGAAAGWVMVECAFALHGWPGLQRYMFEPAGVAVVLAGAAVGWALAELPRVRAGVPAWAGIPLVVLLAVAMLPGALHRVRVEHRDLAHERGRAKLIGLLLPTIHAMGGATHIRACAHPSIDVAWMSPFAWSMGMNIGFVGFHPARDRHRHSPYVVFEPLRREAGWTARTFHLHEHNRASCRNLTGTFAGGHFTRSGLSG